MRQSMAVIRNALIGLILLAGVRAQAQGTYNFTSFDVPGSNSTHGAGINNSGTIVGWYTNFSGTHGFSLSGGVFNYPIDFPGATQTAPSGISNDGAMVGDYDGKGFSLVNGTFTSINLCGGSDYIGVCDGMVSSGTTTAHGINSSGTIAGYLFVPGFVFGCYGPDANSACGYMIWSGIYDFDTFFAAWAEPEGINDNWQIVGYWYNPSTNEYEGFSL